jgi:hypothetical protein
MAGVESTGSGFAFSTAAVHVTSMPEAAAPQTPDDHGAPALRVYEAVDVRRWSQAGEAGSR